MWNFNKNVHKSCTYENYENILKKYDEISDIFGRDKFLVERNLE